MKYINTYKLFESKAKRLSYSVEIYDICRKYNISNYTINDDGSIDVSVGVNLYECGLSELPLRFRNVAGDFHCGSNNLTSLKGCPENVGGKFFCFRNELTSLEGGPKIVGGELDIRLNNISSFEGFPESIGDQLFCNKNPIYNIWMLFQKYSDIELFNDYDIIRGDTIILDRLNGFLSETGVRTVKSESASYQLGWKWI